MLCFFVSLKMLLAIKQKSVRVGNTEEANMQFIFQNLY